MFCFVRGLLFFTSLLRHFFIYLCNLFFIIELIVMFIYLSVVFFFKCVQYINISCICINFAFIFAEKSNLNQLPISSVLYATSDACAATYMQHMLTSCTGLFSRGFYLCNLFFIMELIVLFISLCVLFF